MNCNLASFYKLQFIKVRKVVLISELAKCFKCSKRTIFRELKDIGYLTSYNKNKSGHTLTEVPDFNRNGLWEYQGFRFSQWGTLGMTIQHFVDNSKAGLSAGELQQLIQHDNIYHHLIPHTKAGLIFRVSNRRIPIYYSVNREKRGDQRKSRKQLSEAVTIKKQKDTGNTFNIENLHFGFLAQLILNDTITADDIYMMLDGMGKPVERKKIKEIIIRYDLEEKKNRIQLIFSDKR